MKILIVDDARIVRLKLRAELCDRGHTVIEAKDGMEALKKAESDAPDAVFLDIILPGIDGCEVLRRLRAAHPALPVVMLSTAASAENIARTRENGALMFIQKPYADREISTALGKIRTYMEEQ